MSAPIGKFEDHSSPVAATKPNIVLILSDDQSLDSLAAMPFLRSKPGGHWLEFSNGFVNTPLCCPTRATLLSGLYPHHHGVEQNDGGLFDDSSTLATWLQSAGYRTGLAGKYLNDWPFGPTPTIPPGWSDWFANIEATGYYNYQMYDNGTVVNYGNAPSDYHTDVIARRADQFIRSSAGEPFFLYATPIAPHAPYIEPPRYQGAPVSITRPPNFNEADVSDKPAWVKAKPLMTTSQAAAMDYKRAKSYRMVMAVDDLVRTVYQALEDTGTLDNTVIVFQTDNGFLYGEHRATLKNCVYEECVRSPLFIRVPWVDGRIESRLASSIDIAPTFADLAGIIPPDPVDGTSLMPLIEDPATSWRSSILLQYAASSDRPPFWAIRTADWKYVELETGELELYDMVNDRYELQNRAGDPALAGLQADLAAELLALRTESPHMVQPSLSVSDAQASEGDAEPNALSFSVMLNGVSPDPVTVAYATVDGTATAPDDYQAVSGELTFVPGDTQETVTVLTTADDIEENDESFILELSAPAGAAIQDGSAGGSIMDDDTVIPPTLTVGDVSVAEGDDGATQTSFVVSLEPPAAEPVTVSFATQDGTAVAPGDYGTAVGELTFAPGETSRSVPVDVLGDDLAEGLETFSLALSSPAGAVIGDGVGVGSIIDDDAAATAAISDVALAEGDGGSTSALVTVSLSEAMSQPVTLAWATQDGSAVAPSDYQAASGVVSFLPGELSHTVTIGVTPDVIYEASEIFYVDIASSDVPVTDARGEATITNDDAPPSLAISDVSVTEGTGGPVFATFLVTMSASSGLPASVSYQTANGTALAPGDYLAASGVLTFAPGETSKLIQISVVGDSLRERGETFTIMLSAASGAIIGDGSGRCTIQDND